MKRSAIIFYIIAYWLILPSQIISDTIIWKTKRAPLECKVISETRQEVTVEMYGGKQRVFQKQDVKLVIKSKPPWEVYEDKKRKIKDTVDDHLSLAKWSQEHGLTNETKLHYEKVISLDADNNVARKALGYIKVDDKWRPESEVMIEKGYIRFEDIWLPRDKWLSAMKEKGYALSFRIAIEDDAADENFERLSGMIKGSSNMLWQITKGQFYIGEVIISDKTTNGNVFVPKGGLKVGVLSAIDGGRWSETAKAERGYSGQMWIGGEIGCIVFVHELGHSRLNLPDEEGTNEEGCLMGLKSGSKLCSEDDHIGSGLSC